MNSRLNKINTANRRSRSASDGMNRKKVSAPKQNEQGFGVLLEGIDSKLDLVVEGHQTLDKKIDNLQGEMNERFKEVDYKFGVVFERFNEVDARFNEVDAKFETVFDELHLIRNELKEKVSRDEFLILEKRVVMLEKKQVR